MPRHGRVTVGIAVLVLMTPLSLCGAPPRPTDAPVPPPPTWWPTKHPADPTWSPLSSPPSESPTAPTVSPTTTAPSVSPSTSPTTSPTSPPTSSPTTIRCTAGPDTINDKVDKASFVRECNTKKHDEYCEPQCIGSDHHPDPKRFKLFCQKPPGQKYPSDTFVCKPNQCSGGPRFSAGGLVLDRCNNKRTGDICKISAIQGSGEIWCAASGTQPQILENGAEVSMTEFSLKCEAATRGADTGSYLINGNKNYSITCKASSCHTPNEPDPNIAPNGYQGCTTGTQSGGECKVTCATGYFMSRSADGSITHTIQGSKQLATNWLYKLPSSPILCQDQPAGRGIFDTGQQRGGGLAEWPCRPRTCFGGPLASSVNSANNGGLKDFTLCKAKNSGQVCKWFEATCAPGFSTPTTGTFTLSCGEDGTFDASVNVGGSVEKAECPPAPCTDGADPRTADPRADYSHCVSLHTGQVCAPQCARGYKVISSGQCSLAVAGRPAFSLKCIEYIDMSNAQTGPQPVLYSFDVPTECHCQVNSCSNTSVLHEDPNVVPATAGKPDGYNNCRTKTTGQTCKPTCNPGFVSPGDMQLICSDKNEVDARYSRCVPQNCTGGPETEPDPPFDCQRCNALASGDMCQCSCPSGYDLPPAFPLVCTSQKYDATKGACRLYAHRCTDGTIPGTNNSDVNYDSCKAQRTGDICKATCPSGTILTGAVWGFKLLCLNGRGFDGSQVRCEKTECMNGPEPGTEAPHALYNACNAMDSQQKCRPKCKEGYTEVSPASEPNGFELVCENSTKRYRADPAHACSANKCNSGPRQHTSSDWADYAPCASRTTGQLCTPQCTSGFRLSKSFVLDCDKGGYYDASAAKCDAHGCFGGPTNETVDEHGSLVHCNRLMSGQNCQPQCHSGYAPPAPFQLFCVPPSDSSGTGYGVYNVSGKCTPNDCKMPNMTYRNTSYDRCNQMRTSDWCQPQCDRGYTLSATPDSPDWTTSGATAGFVLRCAAGGGYETGESRCVPNPCNGSSYTAKDPQADYSHCDDLRTDQRCTPTCNKGYTQTGSILLLCEPHLKNSVTQLMYDSSTFSCTPNKCSGGPSGSAQYLQNRTSADYSKCSALVSGQQCDYVCQERRPRINGVIPQGMPEWMRKKCETCQHTVQDDPNDPPCNRKCKLNMTCTADGNNTFDAWGSECEPVRCQSNYRLIRGWGCKKCPNMYTGSEEVLVTEDRNTTCVPINQVNARANYLGRLAVLARLGCETEEEGEGPVAVDWQLHPTRLSLGNSPTQNISGAAVGNCLFFFIWLAVICIVAAIQSRCSDLTFKEGLRNLKWPGCLQLPADFLISGTILYSARLAFVTFGWSKDKPRQWEQAVGWVVTLIIPMGYVGVWRGVLRMESFHAELVPNGAAFLRRIVMGDHDWVNTEEEEEEESQAKELSWWEHLKDALIPPGRQHFCETRGPMFDGYHDGARWFWLVESGLGVFLSVLAAPATENEVVCEIRNWVITASLAIFSFLLVKMRPMIALVPNVLSIVAGVFQFLGMLLVAVSFRIGMSNTDVATALSTAASWCYFVNGLAQMAKLFYDMATLFYGVYAGTKLEKMMEDVALEEEKLKNKKPIRFRKGVLAEDKALERGAWYDLLRNKNQPQLPAEDPLFDMPPCSPDAARGVERVKDQSVSPRPASARGNGGLHRKQQHLGAVPLYERKSKAGTEVSGSEVASTPEDEFGPLLQSTSARSPLVRVPPHSPGITTPVMGRGGQKPTFARHTSAQHPASNNSDSRRGSAPTKSPPHRRRSVPGEISSPRRSASPLVPPGSEADLAASAAAKMLLRTTPGSTRAQSPSGKSSAPLEL